MCEDIKPLPLPTYVSILMHVRENTLTTNTARLAVKSLINSRILLRGAPGAESRTSPGEAFEWAPPAGGLWLEGDREDPALLFLFPSEDARDLSEVKAELGTRPVHLLVSDGNWKQGAKTLKRFPNRSRVIPVKLPEGPKSEFRLRKPPREECVSTFEAIARALGVLHGQSVVDELMHYFHMKQDRLLYARGLKVESEVRGGIPLSARKPWH
jgi:DTW domain-containing protein YfiP